jgi:hypothetical protein
MLAHRPSAVWLRLVAGTFALAGLLALTACGGGEGAPNNPFEPGPVLPAPLTVLPGVSTVYSRTPATLTVSGGVPPYLAFSSNSAVLPVAQTVSGSTVLLVPNDVADNTTVVVTIQDAAGTTATAGVTVSPAPLLPNLVTITPNNDCPGSPQNLGGALCSGGTGTAAVRLTGPGGGALPNRQVRFDVVAGNFALQSSNPATPLVSTLTVVSDVNGSAVVGIAVPVNAPTQIGVLRATDVTTGNSVTGQFTITQVTDGTTVLSVIPANITITGPLQNVCSAGVTVSYFIFGGTPPYRVTFPIPGGLTLLNSTVNESGGHFDAITNGACLDNIPFAITDATGRTIPDGAAPRITNAPGTVAPPAPTPPAALQVAPSTIAQPSGCAGKTFTFLVVGGTPPYSAVVSPGGVGITLTGTNPYVVTYAGSVPTTTNSVLAISDSSGQSVTATITCTASAGP